MADDEGALQVGLTIEGGFGPLGVQPRVLLVSTADLAEDDEQSLRRAVNRVAEQIEAAPGRALSGMPDVMVYRLQLPGSARAKTFDDVTATPEQHELVALIRHLTPG